MKNSRKYLTKKTGAITLSVLLTLAIPLNGICENIVTGGGGYNPSIEGRIESRADRSAEKLRTLNTENDENPDITGKPENDENPDITGKPENDENPDSTGKPEIDENPDITEKPENDENSDNTGKPEIDETPDVTGKPDGIETPEIPEANILKLETKQAVITVEDSWYTTSGGIITGINLSNVSDGDKLAISIPASINGANITGIGAAAFTTSKFSSKPNIRIVSIDFSKAVNLTSIGNYAFRNDSGKVYSELDVNDLVMPENMQSIGELAFEKQVGFKGSLKLSDNLTTLGEHAFNGCTGFINVEFPSQPKFTTIPSHCFFGISFEGELDLPEGITTIGENAFAKHNFTKITFPQSITKIGNQAFNQKNILPTLTTVNFPESLNQNSTLEIESKAFWETNIEVVTIPSYVSKIGTSAFSIASTDNKRGIKTVYLNTLIANANNIVDNNGSLFGMSYDGVIICPKDRYNTWKSHSAFSQIKNNLTYITKVQFSDGNDILGNPAPVDKLYDKAISYTKNDDASWSKKTKGYLPDPLEGYDGWGKVKDTTPVSDDTAIIVDLTTLYPGKSTKYEYMWLGDFQQSFLGYSESDVEGMTEDVDYVKVSFTNSAAYYKIEPIKWKILETSQDGKTYKMISDEVIDTQQFNSNNNNPAWGDSGIRKWLNGLSGSDGFLQEAFTNEEQGLINEKSLSSEGTTDKVYLMSSSDMANKKYFPSSIDLKPTIKTDTYAFDQGNFIGKPNPGIWWLRTQYTSGGQSYATCISEKQVYSLQWPNSYYYVRPMIEITLTDEYKKTGKGTFEEPYSISNKSELIITPKDMVDYIMEEEIDLIGKGESTFPRLVLNAEGLLNGDSLEKEVEQNKTLGDFIKEQYAFYKVDEDGKVSDVETKGTQDDKQTAGKYKIKVRPNAKKEVLNYKLTYNEAELLTRPKEGIQQEEIDANPPTEIVKDPSIFVEQGTEFENSAGETVTNKDVRLIISELGTKFLENSENLTSSIENKIVSEGYKKEDYVAFEMALIDIANGNIFVKPKKGRSITVTLPYPENTNMKDFDFMVLHYKEGDDVDKMFDYDIDNPTVITPQKTAVGLQFQVDALGPFSIAFKEVKESENENENGNTGGGYNKETQYTIIISANSGGIVSPKGKIKVDKNSSKTIKITADEGYEIQDVIVDGKSVGAVDRYEFERIQQNHTVKVYFQKLDLEAHIAYMTGYPDGTFMPDQGITRAEAATIFANLINYEDSVTNLNFTDTDNQQWYAPKVSKIVNKGIMRGYEDNSFRPNDKITRGEFMVVITNINGLSAANHELSFLDTKDHWSKEYIYQVLNKSWIKGYEDNTFRPDQEITRAEATIVINNMLQRECTHNHLDNIKNKKYFLDTNKSHWAYYDIVEATNYHSVAP